MNENDEKAIEIPNNLSSEMEAFLNKDKCFGIIIRDHDEPENEEDFKYTSSILYSNLGDYKNGLILISDITKPNGTIACLTTCELVSLLKPSLLSSRYLALMFNNEVVKAITLLVSYRVSAVKLYNMAIFGRHSNAFGMIPIQRGKDNRGKIYSYIFPLPQSYYLNDQKLSRFSTQNPTITFLIDGDEKNEIVLPNKDIKEHTTTGEIILPLERGGGYVYILIDRDQNRICISKIIDYFLKYKFNRFIIAYNKKVNVNINLEPPSVEMVLYDLIPIPASGEEFDYIPIDLDSLQNCDDPIDFGINYEIYNMEEFDGFSDTHNAEEVFDRIYRMPRLIAHELYELLLDAVDEIEHMTAEEKKEYFNPIIIEQKMNLYQATMNAYIINLLTKIGKYKKLIADYTNFYIKIHAREYLRSADLVEVYNIYKFKEDLQKCEDRLTEQVLKYTETNDTTLSVIQDMSRVYYIGKNEKMVKKHIEGFKHDMDTLISNYINETWDQTDEYESPPRYFVAEYTNLYNRNLITLYIKDTQKFASKPLNLSHFITDNLSIYYFEKIIPRIISFARVNRYCDTLPSDDQLIPRIEYFQLMTALLTLTPVEFILLKNKYDKKLKTNRGLYIKRDFLKSMEEIVTDNKTHPDYVNMMSPYFQKLKDFYLSAGGDIKSVLKKYKELIKNICTFKKKYESSKQFIINLTDRISKFDNHIKTNFQKVEENKKFLKEIKIEEVENLEEVNKMLEKCKDIQLFTNNQTELKELIEKLKLEILKFSEIVKEVNEMLDIADPITSRVFLKFNEPIPYWFINNLNRLDTDILLQFETTYWQELLKN